MIQEFYNFELIQMDKNFMNSQIRQWIKKKNNLKMGY